MEAFLLGFINLITFVGVLLFTLYLTFVSIVFLWGMINGFVRSKSDIFASVLLFLANIFMWHLTFMTWNTF